MPTMILPRFLISSGVMAKADRLMIIGAASTAAPPASTWRRVMLDSFFIFSSLGFTDDKLTSLICGSARGHREAALELRAVERERPADDEVQDANDAVDDQRLEGLVRDEAAGARELGKADDGRERRA